MVKLLVAPASVIIPAYVKVLEPVAAKPPLLVPKVMPRLLAKAKPAVACKAPPFKVIEAAVIVAGVAPKLLSLLIERIPPFTIVPTAKLVVPYVLVPLRITIPVWPAPLMVSA